MDIGIIINGSRSGIRSWVIYLRHTWVECSQWTFTATVPSLLLVIIASGRTRVWSNCIRRLEVNGIKLVRISLVRPLEITLGTDFHCQRTAHSLPSARQVTTMKTDMQRCFTSQMGIGIKLAISCKAGGVL